MFEGCVFCDQSWMRAAEIFIETPTLPGLAVGRPSKPLTWAFSSEPAKGIEPS